MFTSARAEEREPFLGVLDVGQGDSLIIDAGIGVMVDTGNPGQGAITKAQKLGTRVGALVLTHLHADHAGDAVAIIRTRPAAVFWNGSIDSSLYEDIQRAAHESSVPLVPLIPGDVLHAGRARISVLGPSRAYLTSDDPNDTSLVLRVDYPDFSALLTGDATLEVEEHLENVDVDVLKVGHHGSKGSSGEAFLERVSPEVALISSGASNRYGHPAQEALERLSNAGAVIYRTDEQGTLVVRNTPAGIAITGR